MIKKKKKKKVASADASQIEWCHPFSPLTEP